MLATVNKTLGTLKEKQFLFQQLVKRDFAQRYKRTVLGMAWSVLSPLLTLMVQMFVFSNLFGRNVEHYVIYMFSGNIIMSYYREATNKGMTSLIANANVITKINVPKYLFLLSRVVSALVNFCLTVLVYLFFCVLDGITFTPAMLLMVYPALTLTVMSVGVGMVLSALHVFFRDIEYLYGVFLTLLTYLSAIFYTLDHFSAGVQRLFLLNPVYAHIKFLRTVVIDGTVPSPQFFGLLALYALLFLAIGAWVYKRYNHQFLYYL